MPVEKVHLHEVGALDSIIDIVGAVYGLEQLGADRIVRSPLNVGGGTVTCAHGVFPVPAPATARLLSGVPVYSGDVQMELVTPTGALLVTGYAERFGPLPPMTLDDDRLRRRRSRSAAASQRAAHDRRGGATAARPHLGSSRSSARSTT